MIQLTRLNNHPLVVNSDLIKFVEQAPDTVITLLSGEKIVVRESAPDVLERVVQFRRSVLQGITPWSDNSYAPPPVANGSAEGNGFAPFDPTQVTPQQIRGMLLDIDFLLEFHAVAHFHKFVSVAGITVLAGELAAAIRINRPGKWHAYAGASVQQGARGQREVFNIVPFTKRFRLGGKPGDAN